MGQHIWSSGTPRPPPPQASLGIGIPHHASLWGEAISPFTQEMRGAGQAAGRQSRVAASPSSSTWSLSLMWKTGGKSAGRADGNGLQGPQLTLLREGRIHVRGGEQRKSFSLPSQTCKVPPQATLSKILFGASITLSRHSLCVVWSHLFLSLTSEDAW